MGQNNGCWRFTLLSPETEKQLRQAMDGYVRRAGGTKQAVGAAVVGGLTGAAILPRVPYVPATLVGAAGGAWAVQLPEGSRLGDSARQVGAGAAAFWDAVTDSNNWS
mmetsp:Transcript_103872/g.289388  ORF Transcript_103872/g.289388 Transcript_103872/m.289388 type:complete len:107 (+) Transcript_103872:602-922(+)